MIKLKDVVLAASFSLIATQAVAATDSVDVKVSGNIIPPACIPKMAGGAVFDYGGIKVASLKTDSFNLLDKKSLTFSLACDSPMKVAFKSVDGRAGTAVIGGKPLNVDTGKVSRYFGLGQVDGKNIGSYVLGVRRNNLKVDGKDGYVGIYSSDNGVSWNKADYDGIWMDQEGLSSVGLTEDNQPVPLTTLSGYIDLQAIIDKSANLDLTKIINLDGQVSVQVVYL